LNSLYYQEIADQTIALHQSTPVVTSCSFPAIIERLSGELFRTLLMLLFGIQITLLGFIPYGIGRFLSIIQLSWTYSIYSFDYKWSHLAWSQDYRLRYIERRWAYFLGFGLPIVLLTFHMPGLLSSGVFAFMFPFCIILATVASPQTSDRKRRHRLPIFTMAHNIGGWALVKLQQCLRKS
jgi:etoposide-induced 2.4 mRNA